MNSWPQNDNMPNIDTIKTKQKTYHSADVRRTKSRDQKTYGELKMWDDLQVPFFP